MKTLNPIMRSLIASALLAGSALVSGQALATTAAQPVPSSPVTTPLTTPLSVIGGIDTDLTNVRGTFNPTWLGQASDYSSKFNFSDMMLGGNLVLTQAVSNITFTLVGTESTYNNAFLLSGQRLNTSGSNNASSLGNSFSFSNVAAGVLNFGFLSNGAGLFKGAGHASTGVMLAEDNRSALIVFNDRIGDRDFDDMVVRVSVSAVPEPETYAMLLAGLGLLGVVSRRRQRRA